MFYHIIFGIERLYRDLIKNITRDEIFSQYLCPFVNREVTILENSISNMSSFGYFTVFETEKLIDSDWPVKKSNYGEGKKKDTYLYEYNVIDSIEKESKNVTLEFYQEAIILIESGEYKELRKKFIKKLKGNYSFFICPLENDEVEDNYEYVIKPTIKQFQFEIEKADEISHTEKITDVIIDSINRSRFIIADLTDARPNCYYEVGYAHALGKQVIILAKESTNRQFDISTYKWNFWTNYKDLKLKFEKELLSVLRYLGIET